MIEQGETAEAAFDAVDGTIDSMTTTTIFSHCKPNPCGEAAEEQRHTDDNFICSRRRNLSPINNKFVSAPWVSLHSGRDVSYRAVKFLCLLARVWEEKDLFFTK